jgi:hypothetical protein
MLSNAARPHIAGLAQVGHIVGQGCLYCSLHDTGLRLDGGIAYLECFERNSFGDIRSC